MHIHLRVLLTALVIAAPLNAQRPRAPKQTNQQSALTAREIAKKVIPSVVLLVTKDAQGKPTKLGSGFFVDRHTVVTNYHVIKGASSAYAKPGNVDYEDEVLGTIGIDYENDLALLKIDTFSAGLVTDQRGLPYGPWHPPLALAKKHRPEIGDEVYVVGNPEGLEGTFSPGIVSALRGDDYIQITAPISHGSSGGPVLNKYGEVIGVAVGAIEKGQNLNFAIPVSKLAQLLNRKKDSVTRLTPLMPSTAGSGWQVVTSSAGEDYYFNRDRITPTLEHTFLVWIKTVPTQSQEGRVVRKGLIDLLDAAKVVRAYDVSYRMQQLEFDCGRQRIRHLDDAYYDKEGELLHRVNIFSLPEDIRIQMTGWDSVLPESVGEAQLNFVCKVN